MVNVWVVEALEHVSCKLLQFFHWEVESLHELVILYFLDIWTYYWVMESIAYDVDARKVCYRREYCVRTVKESYLSLVVWSLRFSDENMESCLLCREFCTAFE